MSEGAKDQSPQTSGKTTACRVRMGRPGGWHREGGLEE